MKARRALLVALATAVTLTAVAAAGAGSRQATDSAQASSKIAFRRSSDFPTSKPDAIYVVNADGSGKRLLTHSTSHL